MGMPSDAKLDRTTRIREIVRNRLSLVFVCPAKPGIIIVEYLKDRLDKATDILDIAAV